MKVRFEPQGIELEIKPEQSVMQLAHANGLFIKSVCRGAPSCAECRVKVLKGEENLMPPLKKELALIGTAQFVDQSRLSCQMRCFGDVVIDLSEQIEKEKRGTLKKPRGFQATDRESRAKDDIVLLTESSAPIDDAELGGDLEGEQIQNQPQLGVEPRLGRSAQNQNNQRRNNNDQRNNKRPTPRSDQRQPQARALGNPENSANDAAGSPPKAKSNSRNRNRNRNRNRSQNTSQNNSQNSATNSNKPST